MRQEIETFLRLGPDLGLLSEAQAKILREICSDDMPVEDFAELIVTCQIVPDETYLKDFLEWVSNEVHGQESAAPAEAASPWEAPLDLDWFCHLTVADGFLTEDVCLGLLASFEDANELMNFAQFLVSGGVCEDVLKIQGYVDCATESAKTGERPPASVFRARAS